MRKKAIGIDMTRMSSKGQVVIPSDLREGLHEGEKLVVIRIDNQLILEPVSEFDDKLEEDLRAAKRTEEALKRHDRGLFKRMSKEEFLKALKEW